MQPAKKTPRRRSPAILAMARPYGDSPMADLARRQGTRARVIDGQGQCLSARSAASSLSAPVRPYEPRRVRWPREAISPTHPRAA